MFKKCFTLIIVICVAFAISASAAQLEGFNYADDAAAQSEWVLSFFSSTIDSGAVNTSLTDKQEGTSALKLSYTYHGNQWYYMRATKTYATPIDLSGGEKYSFWLKGDAAVNNDLLYIITFISSNNRRLRWVHWGGLGVDGNWNKVEINLTEMEQFPWDSFTDCPVLNDVTKIEFEIQQVDGNTNSNTAVLYFDDLQFEADSPVVGFNELDYFEYADDAALNAVWTKSIPSSPTGFDLQLFADATAFKDGAKSMKATFTFASNWSNCWALKTYNPVQDFSAIKFIKLWVKGDPTNIGARTPTLLVYLEDSNVNRLVCKLNSALKVDGWSCYYLQLKADTDGVDATTNAPFWQDQWDGGGLCDLTLIKKIAIASQDNAGTAGPTYTFSLNFDSFAAGIEVTPPPTPTPTPVITPTPAPNSVRTKWNKYE